MSKHKQVLEHREQINLIHKQIELLEDMIEEHYIKIDQLSEEIIRENVIHNERNCNGVLV